MATKESIAKRHVMKISMGAMALITLATTVIVGAHYWEMLAGIFLVSIIGLALPDWVAWWATYVHAKATRDETEDPRVSWTCLIVSAAMSFVMIVNAGAVLAVWWDDKAKAQHEQTATQNALASQKVTNEGATDAILARGRVIQQMRQAGATNQSIQEYIKAEAARDKAKAETLAPPHPSEQPATYADQVPAPVRKYMAFWVYVVPFMCGLIGLFAIIIAIALPGGVEFSSAKGKHAPGFQPSTTVAQDPK